MRSYSRRLSGVSRRAEYPVRQEGPSEVAGRCRAQPRAALRSAHRREEGTGGRSGRRGASRCGVGTGSGSSQGADPQERGGPAEEPDGQAGSGGSRFLLLSVAIEVGEAAAAESLKSRDAELRDIILTTLSTKSTEELTDISRRESFKEEVVVAIKGRFGKKSVKSLYFPQFVVQ